MPEPTKELTRFDVEAWITTMATGRFHYTKVLDGQVKSSSYGKLRKIMHDIVKKGNICEPEGKNDGWYRPIQAEPELVEWQDIPARQSFPVELPFDLRKWVFIYPNTVIVVAGSKSSGKTGFILRTVVMNMKNVTPVLLTNLEGGREQLRDRLYAMDIEIPNPAPFKVIQASENYHDFITQRNTLYAIDYIDVPESGEFYLIAGQIKKIARKLTDGDLHSVAVIGLQKPMSRKFAYGGEQTLKDAALYIALDNKKLQIVDAKAATDPKVDPSTFKNMAWTFHYQDSGTKFTDIQPFHDINNPDDIPF